MSEGAEGTSQEASLKGSASPGGTVSRSKESVSSPVLPAVPRRAGGSPGSSTEALLRTPPVEPVATSTLPTEAPRGESARGVEVEMQQQEALPAPEEGVREQEEAVHEESQAKEQQLVVKVASLQLGMGADAPAQPAAAAVRAAVAAAAEIVCSATPFAAAAQAPEPQSSDSGEAPPAPATVDPALSHGASALPFAPSAASAMSPVPSFMIPVAPPAGLLLLATMPARDPSGGPLPTTTAPAQEQPAPSDTALHAQGAVSSAESPVARSRSGDSDVSAEQW